MSVSIESAITVFSHIKKLFDLLPQAKKCDVGRFIKRLTNLKKTITKEAGSLNQAELGQLALSAKQIKLVEQLQQYIFKSIEDKKQKIRDFSQKNIENHDFLRKTIIFGKTDKNRFITT